MVGVISGGGGLRPRDGRDGTDGGGVWEGEAPHQKLSDMCVCIIHIYTYTYIHTERERGGERGTLLTGGLLPAGMGCV